jgi:hypothetical protein
MTLAAPPKEALRRSDGRGRSFHQLRPQQEPLAWHNETDANKDGAFIVEKSSRARIPDCLG